MVRKLRVNATLPTRPLSALFTTSASDPPNPYLSIIYDNETIVPLGRR